MTRHPFFFDSVIYNGYDYPRDGIGNHLALFDQLIFSDIEPSLKSLSPIAAEPSPHPYGRVTTNLHLRNPDPFKNALFLDLARETWGPARIHAQMASTVRHKRAFNAVTGVYLMWESSRLWSLYAELISVYDFCIVTSSLLDDQLASRGIDTVKLRHPYHFEAMERQAPVRDAADKVRFGISAGLWRRKNVALLAAEFAAVLGREPRAELSIHTRSDIEHADYRDEFGALDALRQSGAQIEIINRSLSREDYIDWLRSLDVYCFVSSGEGYSITPREALHLGIPVILHDAHVHSEFAHLPGIIPVPSQGTQAAAPNTSCAGHDIGHDWCIDRNALRSALAHAFTHHRSLRAELYREHGKVLEFHDPAVIKAQWVETLNRKYRQYIDKVRLRYPGIWETPLGDAQVEDIDLDFPGIHSATGLRTAGGILCLRGEHAPGHCLYGPYFPVTRAGRYAVYFGMERVRGEVEGDAAVLDVYDGVSDTILVSRRIAAGEFSGSLDEFCVDVDLCVGQVIEFRVYWTGNHDLMVSRLRVESRMPLVAAAVEEVSPSDSPVSGS